VEPVVVLLPSRSPLVYALVDVLDVPPVSPAPPLPPVPSDSDDDHGPLEVSAATVSTSPCVAGGLGSTQAPASVVGAAAP